jgi:predicted dehydrogenase
MDYGSHGMAGVLSVLGPDWRPVKVQAINIDVLFRHRILQGDPWLMESDDNAQFKVMLENAKTGGWATIFMEATWCGAHIGPKEMRSGKGGGGFFRIEGDKGMIDACNHPSITIKHWDGGETVIPTKEYPGETVSFEDEIGTMINCVGDGCKPWIDINFGAEIIAICDAAYWSAIEKRTVTLEEFKTHARSYVKKYGDNEEAELALLKDLLAPYAWKGQP